MIQNSATTYAIPHSEHKLVPGAAPIGPADPLVRIRVRPQHGAAPSTSLGDMSGTPPRARHYLSREAFAAQYGASAEDLASVTAYAAGHGLKVEESNAARRTVVVSGTVQAINKAFS